MKTIAQFQTLAPEDRQKIFELCDANPYEAVLVILARPRAEGGFDFRTSYSTLRRFYITFNPHAEQVQTIEQYAESLQIWRQHADGAFYAAILAHVETHLLQALKNGRPIADLDKEFQILARLHRSFVSQEQLRLHERGATRELKQFLNDCNEQDAKAAAVVDSQPPETIAPPKTNPPRRDELPRVLEPIHSNPPVATSDHELIRESLRSLACAAGDPSVKPAANCPSTAAISHANPPQSRTIHQKTPGEQSSTVRNRRETTSHPSARLQRSEDPEHRLRSL